MRITLWLFIFTTAISVECHEQRSASIDSRVTAALARMSDKDMATRHAGFDDLIEVIAEGEKLGPDPEYTSVLAIFLARNPDQANRVKLGLINLLNADDGAFMDSKAAPGTYTEDDTEHWAQAIDLVSCLNDERAIPALVGAMTAGGGSCKGLLSYGQKALGPVLSELSNPNPLVRSSAVSIGIIILRMKNDAASHAQILSMIRTTLNDPEYLVRSSALSAIEDLNDRAQFARSLQEIGEHDPFIVPGETNYPLRTRARKLLQEIATPK